MQSFFLQDSRSYTGDGLMFWALGGGYTTNIDQAERFTQDQAQGQHDCRETDVPWPADYIEQRAHRGVDCQYVSQAEAAPMLAQSGPVVLHVPKDWNGNDLIWIGSHGQRGPVLDLARWEWTAADLEIAKSLGCIAWPLRYIEGKARRLVHRQNVSHVQAIRGTGIVLQKPRKPKERPLNCGGCGRFISWDRRFFEDCRNCGQDNRP
ncbi:hypothetical protein [uncultured Pseudomonas sp.]|uniref:hypothetical protein n=1 Tax=uncultured Pseudomonas sp. TaxID=114707 RepID=UPI0025910E34|nr:hypothetical protein [uncultured Pseudomonas sp.]